MAATERPAAADVCSSGRTTGRTLPHDEWRARQIQFARIILEALDRASKEKTA